MERILELTLDQIFMLTPLKSSPCKILMQACLCTSRPAKQPASYMMTKADYFEAHLDPILREAATNSKIEECMICMELCSIMLLLWSPKHQSPSFSVEIETNQDWKLKLLCSDQHLQPFVLKNIKLQRLLFCKISSQPTSWSSQLQR